VTWDTTAGANGAVGLTAVATDTSGNRTTSAGRAVTVSNVLLSNAGLEVDANRSGAPDCWAVQAGGINAGSARHYTSVHGGGVSELVSMSGYRTGLRGLAVAQTPTCAPTVAPGASYKLSTWYGADAAVRMQVWYRNAAGAWTAWVQSPAFAASTTRWVQAVWTTPPMPAGATAISFGLVLQSNGNVVTDDYGFAHA
jgi:hypothetical protein